jgi:hypothetical protein
VSNSFLFTVAGIILVTLVGTFVSGRMRDRCLKNFSKFLTTLEMTDGRTVWGTMHVMTTGIELTYPSDYFDRDHVETSFLLYKDEFDSKMFLLARYHTDLDDRARRRRERILRKSYRPNLFRRMLRSTRNAANTVRDSLNKVLSLVIGQAARTTRHSAVFVATQQADLTKAGQDILGFVGTSYEPMLEKRVGTKIVFELNRQGNVTELVGILKEYSGSFIELLDVDYPSSPVAKAGRGMPTMLAKDVICRLEGASLEIRNESLGPITVETVVVGAETKPGESIAAGSVWQIEVPADCPQVEVYGRWVRKADLIVPRSRAVVRHQAERFEQKIDRKRIEHAER